jgi:predicted nucleic-acid-binding protein
VAADVAGVVGKILESLYVQTKHFKVLRIDAATSLRGILLYKGVVNSDRDVLTKSLSLFAESNLAPVDCILLQKNALEGHNVRTFDKDMLKRIVKR